MNLYPYFLLSLVDFEVPHHPNVSVDEELRFDIFYSYSFWHFLFPIILSRNTPPSLIPTSVIYVNNSRDSPHSVEFHSRLLPVPRSFRKISLFSWVPSFLSTPYVNSDLYPNPHSLVCRLFPWCKLFPDSLTNHREFLWLYVVYPSEPSDLKTLSVRRFPRYPEPIFPSLTTLGLKLSKSLPSSDLIYEVEDTLV